MLNNDWDEVLKIVFESEGQNHDDAIKTYDMSEAQDKSIIAYIMNDYTIYITSNGKMYANKDMSGYFWYFTGLVNMKGLENVDTSQVTNMQSMFYGASGLTALDLRNFDTARVTNMEGMFCGASGLTALDLSNFDTSQVTAMSNMFYGVSGLAALDVSNFDTSQVTSMSYMFYGASGLTALDVSSFDTSQVTNMGSMFRDCSSLTELDLSNMTFDGVTRFGYGNMFEGVPNNIHIKVKGEAAKAFIEARLAEANITEGVVEIVSR